MPRRSLARLYKDEFTGYSLAKFQQDLLAGLTVAAVALPLALAFGVASGASAAAGLVTAILAGFIMGALGCQTITYVERCEIPEVKQNPEAGCPPEKGGGGAGGESDAGDQ